MPFDELADDELDLFERARRVDGLPTQVIFFPYVAQAAMAVVVAGAGERRRPPAAT